jgi:hypothetical protein
MKNKGMKIHSRSRAGIVAFNHNTIVLKVGRWEAIRKEGVKVLSQIRAGLGLIMFNHNIELLKI